MAVRRFAVVSSLAAVLLSAGALAPCAHAQMDAAPDAAMLGKPMPPAQALDAMLSEFEHEAMGVARAMPADKYSYAPPSSNGAKFLGVRTFAGEVTHLIGANYYFFSTVSGQKPDVDMKSLSAMTDKEQIVKALEASFAYAHKAVGTITPENAFLTIKGADGMNTRATLASFAVAHGYDHYGQMVEYLRMNGVVPPGSK